MTTTSNPLSTMLGEHGPLPRLTHAEEMALAQQVSAGQTAEKHLQRGRLTPQRRRILQKTARAGLAAREALVVHNLPLVVSVAGRFRNTGLETDDLIQEGMLGLLKAAEKYDPRRGTRFGTLAVWWIRQSIGRAVANTGRAVRLPVNRGWRVSQLRRMAAQLAQENGAEPTVEAIARKAEMPAHAVAEMLRDGQAVISLEASATDPEDRTVWERIADDTALDPEELAIEHSLTDAVAESLARLDPREAELLRLRFGLDGGEARPLRSIAAQWAMSPEGVRQIGERALGHLMEVTGVRELQAYLQS